MHQIFVASERMGLKNLWSDDIICHPAIEKGSGWIGTAASSCHFHIYISYL